MLRVKDVGTVPFPGAVAARRACRWAGIENWGRERVVELIRSILGSVVLFRRWCFVGMFGGVRQTFVTLPRTEPISDIPAPTPPFLQGNNPSPNDFLFFCLAQKTERDSLSHQV